MTKPKMSGWGCATLLVITPFLIAATTSLRCWVVWVLWRWFAVPLGAPRVGIWHLAGAAMLLWIMTSEHWLQEPRKSENDREFITLYVNAVLRGVIGPLAALGFAYIFRALAGLG